MFYDGRTSPESSRVRCPGGEDGFTLVEVVISIAVTSFVIISILGLMAYASQVVQQSDRNARLSTVTGQVLTTLANQSFYVSRGMASTNNLIFYFTSEGLPTNSSGAYYQCSVSNVTPTGYALKDVFGSQVAEPVRIMIRWPKPASTTAPFPNTNFVTTSIANYD
jgi:Tfp pilus assembly protein PilV